MMRNKKILVFLFVFLSLNFLLVQNACPRFLGSHYLNTHNGDLDEIGYNPQQKDAEAVLEKSLHLKEYEQRLKGYGRKSGDTEWLELTKAKFSKEETPFRHPFFRILLFSFALFCLLESILRRKRKLDFSGDVNLGILKSRAHNEKIILLFLLSAALILFSFFEYNMYQYEAYDTSVLAKDIIDGEVKSNPINYATQQPFMGFTTFNSILLIPFLWLFNGSQFGLLLFCLLYKIAILILLYCFTYRFFGPKAAIITGFLFVFSPYAFAQFSMAGIDVDHFHCLLFILANVYIFFALFLGKIDKPIADDKKVYLLFSLLGLVGGLGAYLGPNCLISVIFCLLFMSVCYPKIFFKKHLYIYITSFFLGLTPRIYYLFVHNFAWVQSDPELAFPFSPSYMVDNICHLLPNLSRVFFFNLRYTFIESADFGYLSADILYLLFIISFAVILIKVFQDFIRSVISKKAFLKKKELFLLGYITIYLVVIGFFPPGLVRARYLFSLYPFIFMLSGIFIEKILDAEAPYKRVKSSLLIFFVFCVILAGSLNAREIVDKDMGAFMKSPDLRKIKGYSIAGYLYLPGMKNSFAKYAGQNIYLQDIIPSSKYEDAKFKSHLALGVYMGDKMEGELNEGIPSLINYSIKPEYRTLVYEGLAISYTYRFFDELYSSFKKGVVSKIIPGEFQHYFYTNFGFRIGKRYKNNLSKAICSIETFPKEYEPYLYRGLIFSLDEKNLQKLFQGGFNSINKNYLPLFFRQAGRILDKDRYGLSYLIKEIPGEYVSFFFQGAGSDWSVDYEDHPRVAIKKRLDWIWSISDDLGGNDIKYLYEGVGLEAGIKEAVFPDLAREIPEYLLDKEYLPYFYRGYGKGIFIRSMNVSEAVDDLLKTEIEGRWFKLCYDGVREEAKLYQR